MTIKCIFPKACLTALLPMVSIFSLAQPSRAQSDTILWEIESPKNTVYLLGSIHLLRETDYPLAQPIQAAFEDAETVVFEIDLAESESPQTVQTFLEAAIPDGPDELLITALDAETYQLAEETAADFGFPLLNFHNLEPWAFYLSIAGLQFIKLGFEPEYGVDAYFYNQAVQTDKTILSLETIEEQLGFFDTLSAPIQADLVEQTMLELDTFEESMDSMIAAWKAGDVAALERLTLEGFADFPEVYDAILVQRNQNWIPDIESFINQSEDYLVIVGAAHLVGPDNVIQLLQDKGYSVQQASM